MLRFRSKTVTPAEVEPSTFGSRYLGLDINSTRIRGVIVAQGQLRTLQLDPPDHELPLVIRMDRRKIELGRVALGECRKIPHDVCMGYLALIGQSHEWRGSRHTVTPDSATRLSLNAIRDNLAQESRSIGFSLPIYLNSIQVRAFRATAHECGIAVKGTVVAPLAIAAHRAVNIGSDGTALIIDADEYALSASLVAVTSTQVRMLTAGLWPHLSLRVWKSRMIDAISDRCVRICRRDPRDSAVAEQGLYDQLDNTLDAVRQGQKMNVTLRADHWYQDLPHTPDDFESYCSPLSGTAAEMIQNLLTSTALATPPRTIWLTHAASQLPGLASRIFRNSSEQSAIGMLPLNAAAEAVAALVPRWESARLDTAHQCTMLPWERLVSSTSSTQVQASPPELPAKQSPQPAPRPSLPVRQGGADAKPT